MLQRYLVYKKLFLLFSRCHIQLLVTPWTAAHKASLSFTIFWSLLKLMSIRSVMPSNHLFLCHPLLLLPSIFPSIRVFTNESALHVRWPKYWSFNFSISPSNKYSGLISFRIDWFDLLAVQGTLKSLLQKHLFFGVQPSLWSNSHIHTWLLEKTIALTIWTFVSKVMSLLFNTLSRFVIAFLTRSKCPLISWLQSSSAVILEKLGISIWWSLVDISQRFYLEQWRKFSVAGNQMGSERAEASLKALFWSCNEKWEKQQDRSWGVCNIRRFCLYTGRWIN